MHSFSWTFALAAAALFACASPRSDDYRALELLKIGHRAFLTGDLRRAERNLRAAAALRGDAYFAQLYLAHSLYFQGKYADSIAPYEQALVLTEHTGDLGPTERRIVIDQLGMAYGLSGRLEEARSYFEKAIERDPSYAMFHYNLACAHAELGNLEAALAALERAVACPPLPEPMPNPRDDDSFRRYRGQAPFEQAMDRMGFAQVSKP